MAYRDGGLAAAALSLAFVATAAAAAPPVITQPDWLARPSGESMARHYPPLATELAMSGYAAISCLVDAQGALTDCRAFAEAPAGLGFGQAAIAMGGEFRMKPQTLNGQAVAGGTVRIPIKFVTPPPEPIPALPDPISGDAKRQALRLLEVSKYSERALEGFETRAKKIETMGSDPAVGRAAADAFRQGVQSHREDIRDGFARAFASVFSESEMSAIADYTQAADDQREANANWAKVQALILSDSARELTAASHAAFCAKSACGGAEDVQRVWRPADPRDVGLIDIPQWIRQPSAAALRRAAPRVTAALGLTAVVRLVCKVGSKGELTACSVQEQAPNGLGYGEAALSLVGYYQLNPIQVHAGAEGRRVTVRVGFSPPDPAAALRLKAGPEAALALARKIANDQQVGEEGRLRTEIEMADFATNPPKGSDPKIYDSAVEAIRLGAKQALATSIDLSVANLSTAFSEKQLQLQAAFQSTPAGKAQRERSKELGIALSHVQQAVHEKIVAEARLAFCATRDCSPSPSAQSKAASSAPSTRTP